MKATTLLCTVLTSLFLAANLQAQEGDLILTEDQNSEWIEDLNAADLEESLDLVKQRILSDTDVFYISTRNAHGKDRVEQEFREKSYCRPVYSFTSERNR